MVQLNRGGQTLNALQEAVRRCRRAFMFVAFFSLAINLLLLTAPIYMLQLFDRVITSNSQSTLIYLTIVAAFAMIVWACLDIVRSRVLVGVSTWLDRRINSEVLSASVDMSLHKRIASVQPLHDLATVRSFLTGPSIFPILDAPWTPIFLAVVFLLHPLLGWFGAVGALFLFTLAVINEVLTRGATGRSNKANMQAMHEAQDLVRNADVIHAMGMMPNVAQRWSRVMDSSLIEQRSANHRTGAISAFSKLVRQLIQIGALGIGAYLVLQNALTPGGMIAGSILMARAMAPVDQAIASWRTALMARAAYDRLHELFKSLPPKIEPTPRPKPKGKLSVENITYAYPGFREPLLRRVSFSLEPGESLGIVGPTASGKTSLARVLVGNLKPQMGQVRLDGSDMAEWDTGDRGQYIGYLPQDVELLAGTVGDNIARMGHADPQEIFAAAGVAGIHETILSLPHGYDTQVNDAGLSLSGGQRQRVALARALFGNPSFVVLDEPNANLDMTGDVALIGALEQLKKRGTTVIIIAHRPNVLRSVDKILVMKEGSVHMMGPRDEVFAELLPQQARRPGKQEFTEQPNVASEGRAHD